MATSIFSEQLFQKYHGSPQKCPLNIQAQVDLRRVMVILETGTEPEIVCDNDDIFIDYVIC